jgi:hypothetical protein
MVFGLHGTSYFSKFENDSFKIQKILQKILAEELGVCKISR